MSKGTRRLLVICTIVLCIVVLISVFVPSMGHGKSYTGARAIDSFALITKNWPEERGTPGPPIANAIKILTGDPYHRKKLLAACGDIVRTGGKDVWGQDLIYRVYEEGNYTYCEIRSFGPNGKNDEGRLGNGDDFVHKFRRYRSPVSN